MTPSKAEEIAAKMARMSSAATAPPSGSDVLPSDEAPVVEIPDVVIVRDEAPEEQARRPASARRTATTRAPAKPRTSSVKLSLALSPAEHRKLLQLGITFAGKLGTSRVSNQTMLHALVVLLLENPSMQSTELEEVETLQQ
ncbi:MAG: hypothetical protein QG597_591, partial [Actinomycetota bacterium]|nr:hypothetical protein [Actinomycetota bacterium]